MADITCPVCRSANAPTRTFCWKCAADLHAVVPDAVAAPPPPKVEVPIQPLLIGGGLALAAIALIAVVIVLLGGSPAASIAPSDAPSGVSTTAPASDGTGGASPSAGAVTLAPATEPPVTESPAPTEAPPATPKVTPVPKPKIVEFKGPGTVDCTAPGYSGFIKLTWLIDNADSTTLSIDGGGLYKSYPGAQGSDEVPFSCGEGQHTYTLSTVGGTGPAASKTLTITEG